MKYKQCKFWDFDSDKDGYFGGIAILEDYDSVEVLQGVICGCCGGFVKPDDIAEIKYYNEWIDLCDTVIGDEHT